VHFAQALKLACVKAHDQGAFGGREQFQSPRKSASVGYLLCRPFWRLPFSRAVTSLRFKMLDEQAGVRGRSSGSPPRPAQIDLLGISARMKRSSVAPLLPFGVPPEGSKPSSGDSPPTGHARGHRGSIPRAPMGPGASSEMPLLRKKAGKIEDFVPELVVRHICAGNESGAPVETPSVEHFPAVAMFADLSGFTHLCESLAAKGALGAETLGFWLNRYFELLVKIISKSGGDVFKFAGDALVVLWPPDQGEERDASPTRAGVFSPATASGARHPRVLACL
jgi:hypothetical protein